MIKAEYIRNLHANYERMPLVDNTENRYQYGMLTRGGIDGLLETSLRNVDGEAFLYYDITSKQTILQLYQKECIDRQWVLDFFGHLKQLGRELYRFLLDEENVLFEADQIFQELDKNRFYFLYYPYYKETEEGKNNRFLLNLCGFLVEHADYNDTGLVDFLYHLYDQIEKNGQAYFCGAMWEELERLEHGEEVQREAGNTVASAESPRESDEYAESLSQPDYGREIIPVLQSPLKPDERQMEKQPEKTAEKKGIIGLFDHRKKKEKESARRKQYEEDILTQMEGCYVAEETCYSAEETHTAILSNQGQAGCVTHFLMDGEGLWMQSLVKQVYVVGKSKEKCDIILEDLSVSRMHCRILPDKEKTFLEDLNSTNGTFLNGMRLAPYQKLELHVGDEIRCGNSALYYR